MLASSRMWRCFFALILATAGSVSFGAESLPPTEESVAARKAVSDEAYAQVKKCYDIYITYIGTHPDVRPKDIPKSIMEPLQRAFETWTTADKNYVLNSAGLIEHLAANGAKRKPLAAALVKYCDERHDDEMLFDFPVIAGWYALMQGRVCAVVGDHDGAIKAWRDILEDEHLNAEQRKQQFQLKKFVLRELVALKMKLGRFSDVVDIVEDTLGRTEYAEIFREDLGKELLVSYAQALSRVPDAGASEFEKGIHRLQQAIAAEPTLQQNERTPWTGRFSIVIAETLTRAQASGAMLKLSALEEYSGAFGAFVLAQLTFRQFEELQRTDREQAKPQYQEVCAEYQRAIDAYRRAIVQARNAKTPLAVRLAVEPRAWFEMGFCYLRMHDFYEAVIAFQALRETYRPDQREKWLAEQIKSASEKVKLAKTVQETLKTVEPLLKKGAQSIRYAFEENRKIHSDLWNKNFGVNLYADSDPEFAPENAGEDPRYVLALGQLSFARSLAQEGREQKNEAQRRDSAALAAAKFIGAAEAFARIDAASKSHEAALFQAGSAYSQAQALWSAEKRLAKSDSEREEMIRTLARNALDSFQKYEDFVKAHVATAEEVGRRQQRDGAMLLSRAALFAAQREWKKSVASADAYLQWEQRTSQTQSVAEVALLHKFRALVELAASQPAPQCDAFLTEAESAMSQHRKLKPDDAETFVFMLRALQRRYTVATAQAEKLGLSPEAVRGYHSTLAGLQESFISTQVSPSLNDFANLVYHLDRSGDIRRVVDAANRLLDTFDPKGLGARIADAPQPWQALLEKMMGAIKYSDLAKWDRCKSDHRVLIDYLYDTREAAQYTENNARRPDFDRYNLNLEKAQGQLETIRKNYPDCQTLDARFGQDGKTLLAIAEEEIDFRRKIAATRELLITKALERSGTLHKNGQLDEARACREIARRQINILLAFDEDNRALILQSVELDIQNGKLKEARASLEKLLLAIEDQNSLPYFDASKKLAEVHAALGNWNLAAEYPQFLMLTIGADAPRVKERWAGLQEFLKQCYEHGAAKK